ncbi:sensor histidine kinase [Massiliimalia massiliensis]|uniref:sensor histidine kinase n=1 Tax=Massiliimalia massiliensis TaxID=1852384 RepID=UPI000985D81A|nr:histidine kinase N-terminal 7TM domain-containing protein [Massiliimalia massiliensis]
MYISNSLMAFFIISIILMVAFIITMVRTRQVNLLHKFYFAAVLILIIWLLALIGIKYTDPENIRWLMILDGITNLGGTLIPPCSLLFVICYTKKYESNLPKGYWCIFILPILSLIMIFTNNFHHLFYRVFSLSSTTVVFGPYFPIHSAYTFACVALSVILMIRFAFKTKTRLHIWQAILFTIGSLAPSLTNLLVVGGLIKATIVITPISFIVTIIFHGLVIYRLHLFDVKPIAMQQLVNLMGDCYLIINQNGLIIGFNQPFAELLGRQHGIRENIYLHSCVQNEDVENKTAVYNLLNAIHYCQETNVKTAYEQSCSMTRDGETIRCYYMVEVTPLVVKGSVCGFLSIFKDVTQIKVNMQQLQASQVKMMEQERLAFLGQMVGGLAHNLKTPIMSISGSLSAVENLIQECTLSIGDADVTPDDYHEIYAEMDSWLQRMRESCAYMSDIITAVKGQASSMNVSDSVDFSLTETFKRVSLLLRHELLNSRCSLIIENRFDDFDIMMHGDINNLVQVVTNLVSNAIDAQTPDGRHDIIISIDKNDEALAISVKDFGSGIPEKVRTKLLKQMITSKGNQGTGLGVFISNTVIHAKFDGSMWFEENPGGGTIWVISIPLDHVAFVDRKEVMANEKE